jgi:Kdo2-lipid IVA lauroyltransferase/acyltransferase
MPESSGPMPGTHRCSLTFGLRLRYALAAVVFFAGYRVLGLRRRVIRGNLERSFPQLTLAERERIRRDFVTRQSEVLAELDYARVMTADELRQRVRVTDRDGVLADSDRIVMVAGHQCNFEWLLLRLSLELGSSMLCVYKPLGTQWAERYFRTIRCRFGAQLLPSKQIRQEWRAVREARAMGLVADQVPRTSPERHWTRFMRQHTAFFMGPERLARLLRARVVFLSMRRAGRGLYEIEIEPLTRSGEKLAEGEATERYARALERDIDADPAGWWWSHQRWKKLRGEGQGQEAQEAQEG